MADNKNYDVIFLGGGLAAGLAALLLQLRCPELSFLILDNKTPSPLAQTWSFQTLPRSSDPSSFKAFSEPENTWLKGLISKSWPGYEVRFPSFHKNFSIPYHSIRSCDFWRVLSDRLGSSLLTAEKVESVKKNEVITAAGKTYRGLHLIDARGWAENAFDIAGYQKFFGMNIRLKRPHGLIKPILMDATVAQLDGFRFLYTLPWNEQELLIEDTRYSNDKDIDELAYKKEIIDYAERQGWDIDHFGEMERGALALPSFSAESFSKFAAFTGVASIGARAGLFHPTTGYSIYDAVATAEFLAKTCEESLGDLGLRLKKYSDARWISQEFYRRLNNMLFFAAQPELRYRVLERFYDHDADLISRFYAGKTTTGDKLRIMSGKPPISMKRAIYHFFNRAEVQHGSS